MEILNYFTYKRTKFSCPKCDWYGLGEHLRIGELFSGCSEMDCPNCRTVIGVVGFPTVSEAANRMDELSEDDKLMVEVLQLRIGNQGK